MKSMIEKLYLTYGWRKIFLCQKLFIAGIICVLISLVPLAVAQEAGFESNTEAAATVNTDFAATANTRSNRVAASTDVSTNIEANAETGVNSDAQTNANSNTEVIVAGSAEATSNAETNLDSQATLNAEATTQADAELVTSRNLKFKRIGEGFSDLAFRVKAFFTFNEDSRLELLKDRNEQLRARQEAWLETKATALAQFKKADFTVEQKQRILAEIQAEHHAIIDAHLALTGEIREAKEDARTSQKASVEAKAEAIEASVESSETSVGLDVDGDFEVVINGFLRASKSAKAKAEARAESETNAETETTATITEADARATVAADLGLTVENVRTEADHGTKFFVVTGTKVEEVGSKGANKYEVWVDMSTGAVVSVAVHGQPRSPDRGSRVSVVIGDDAETTAGTGIRAETGTTGEARTNSGKSETGAQASSSTETRTSGRAQGGASGSATSSANSDASVESETSTSMSASSSGSNNRGTANSDSDVEVRIG